MPTVPLYGGTKVAPEAVPGARIGAQYSPDAFGAAVGRGLQDVGQAADNIYQREKAKQNAIVLMDADLKAGLLANKLNNDALQVKGRDTLGLHEDMLPKLQGGLDEIEASLSSPEQRAAFHHIANGHVQQFDDTLMRHTTQQLQQWGDQTAEASKQLAADQIPQLTQQGDMAGVQTQLDKIKSVIQVQGAANSWAPERIQAEVAERQSAGHASVIQSMIAADNDIAAKSYWEAHKDDLVGADVKNAAAQVEASSTRAESQRQADGIMASSTRADGTVDLKAVEAALKKISDPKIREATTSNIHGDIQLHEQARTEQRGHLVDQAKNMIDRIGGTASDKITAIQKMMPTAYFNDPEVRNHLDKYAEYSAAGLEPATDWKKYAEWEGMSQQDRAAMSQGELEIKYRPFLNNDAYAHALTMWSSARNAQDKKDLADPVQTNLMDFKDRTKNAFFQVHPELAGQEMSKWGQDNVNEYIAVEQAVQFKINALEASGGGKSKDGKATPQQVQEQVDEVNMQRVFVPGRVYGGTNKFIGQMSDTDRVRATIPFAQIPPTVVDKIKGLAQSLGNKGLNEAQYERAAAMIRMRMPDSAIQAYLKNRPIDPADLYQNPF